jgi:hypothetical protein
MIKDKQKRKGKIEINLSGPDGNAYVLLGFAANFAKQLDLDGTMIRKEMTSGDYENLIQTFDKYFGDFVVLYRK